MRDRTQARIPVLDSGRKQHDFSERATSRMERFGGFFFPCTITILPLGFKGQYKYQLTFHSTILSPLRLLSTALFLFALASSSSTGTPPPATSDTFSFLKMLFLFSSHFFDSSLALAFLSSAFSVDIFGFRFPCPSTHQPLPPSSLLGFHSG